MKSLIEGRGSTASDADGVDGRMDRAGSTGGPSDKVNMLSKLISSAAAAATSRGGGGGSKSYLSDIDINTGADIIERYRNEWVLLHEEGVNCAAAAETVASSIAMTESNIQKKQLEISKLHNELSYLPDISDHLRRTVLSIDVIDGLCARCEEALTILEDLCEEGELQTNKTLHRIKLIEYGDTRQAELKQFKVKLAKEHANRIRANEELSANELKSRQKELDETIQTDLALFKKPSVPNGPMTGGEGGGDISEFTNSTAADIDHDFSRKEQKASRASSQMTAEEEEAEAEALSRVSLHSEPEEERSLEAFLGEGETMVLPSEKRNTDAVVRESEPTTTGRLEEEGAGTLQPPPPSIPPPLQPALSVSNTEGYITIKATALTPSSGSNIPTNTDGQSS